MADKEIPALPAGTAPGGTEVFHGSQGGNSRKFTATQLNAAVGTSFPGSPSDGDRLYRTDRNIEYFYQASGTRWLSTGDPKVLLLIVSPLTATTATAAPFNLNPWWGLYDIYVERGMVSSFNTATTAANYFTFQFRTYEAATASNLGTTSNGQNDTQNAFVNHAHAAINTVVASTVEAFDLQCTETGTASANIMGALIYRLIG